MRFSIIVGVGGRDVDVEVGAHLVDESDGLAREFACRTFQCAQMRVDERRPIGGQTRREFGSQTAGPVGQHGGVGGRTSRDLCAQCGVAGVGVDEALFETVEGEAEP